jgi:hypothetical protein
VTGDYQATILFESANVQTRPDTSNSLKSAGVMRRPETRKGIALMRFTDGSETNLRREDFGILRSHRDATAGEGSLLDGDRQQYIIHRCVVGSRAFGLDTEK